MKKIFDWQALLSARTLLLLIFSSILVSGNLYADEKKYQGLLWQISGNGLEKPSYLYGTMHVSNKIAFHLSDTFYVGIKNCDIIALEMNPETMMEDLLEMTNINPMSFGSGNKYGNNNYFYEDNFSIEHPTNKDIGEILSENESIINSVLYRRYGGFSDNFRESTYLDLYIFQAGRKMNKGVLNLEDFETSMKLVMQAYMPDEDEKRNNIPKSYRSGQSIQDLIEEAYRKGDLDMLDSLSRMTDPSEKFHKYMIVERNKNMAARYDSVLKFKTVFAGVGAAHLPGEEGMIELLREKGYTVRPVQKVVGDFSKQMKKDIDTMRYKLSFHEYMAPDSSFRLKSPGKFLEMPSSESTYQHYYCPDMANGSYFTISRIKTYNSLYNKDLDTMLLRIDSLFYENIPGDIHEEKEITVNGIRGYEIINKLLRGDFQRYWIFATDNEIIMFKISGPDEFVKSEQGNEFFNSIEFLNSESSDFKTFAFENTGFEINMPANTIHDFNTKIMEKGEYNEMIGHDPSDNSFYFLRKSLLYDYYYIEEDTFELNYIPEKFAEGLDFEITERSIEPYLKYPSVDVLMNKDDMEMKARLVIMSNEYFLLLTNADEAKAESFLNSLKFNTLSYSEKLEEIRDTNLLFTVKTVKEKEKFNAGDMYTMAMRHYEKDSKYTDKYGSKNYSCPKSGATVNVRYQKFNKFLYDYDYDYEPEDEDTVKSPDIVLNEMIDTIAATGSYTLLEKKITENDSIYEAYVRYGDTASAYSIIRKYIVDLKHKRFYTITTSSDTLSSLHPFVKTFYDTFTPLDTLADSSAYKDKAEMFLEDIYSEDSTVKADAFKALYMIDFGKEHTEKLMEIITDYPFEKDNRSSRLTFIRILGGLKGDRILPFFKELYLKSIDTASIQMAVLSAVARQSNDSSGALFMELLGQDTPLTDDNSDIYGLFEPFRDSLELAVDLFPELLDYAEYPEYADAVYELLAKLKEKELIGDSIYTGFKKRIIRDASITLKRRLAAESSINYSSYSNYYGRNYSYGGYGYNKKKSKLESLSMLLYDYYDEPLVRKFFDKMLFAAGDNLKYQTLLLHTKHNIPVIDTMYEHFAEDISYRNALYESLKEMDKLDLFPEKYKNQQSICESYIFNDRYDTEKDSIEFIDRKTAGSKSKSGYIYFFKRTNTETEKTFLEYVAFQPMEEDSIELEPDIKKRYELDEGEDIEEQMEKIVRDLRLYGRERATIREERYYGSYYDY